PSNFTSFSTSKSAQTPIVLYRSRRGSSSDKQVYIAASQIAANSVLADRIKVLVSKASPGGDEYPHAVLGSPFVALPGSVSTETYLIVDMPEDLSEADN